MANQEHLDILTQGVEVWNQWRKEHPDIQPDLSGADLSEIILTMERIYSSSSRESPMDALASDRNGTILGWVHTTGCDLSGTDLIEATLSAADLRWANLRKARLGRTLLIGAQLGHAILHEADLTGAVLSGANLGRADLTTATLRGARLDGTDLSGADLSGADLTAANFYMTELNGTQFSQTMVMGTVFGEVNLSVAKGLHTMRHLGPSIIDIKTIYRSQGKVPEAFLRDVGVPDSFITYAHSLVSTPLDYYSCFISYSSRDEFFAERLHADLQDNGVRCWFAPQDLKIGAKIRLSVDESIRLYDKLLLVLSRYSVASQWVEQEVERALARERKENKMVLLPISLDKTVMKIEEGWPAYIRNTRNIGDFTYWKRPDIYQKALIRLLRDLKAEP